MNLSRDFCLPISSPGSQTMSMLGVDTTATATPCWLGRMITVIRLISSALLLGGITMTQETHLDLASPSTGLSRR